MKGQLIVKNIEYSKFAKMVLSKMFRTSWNLRYSSINSNPYLGSYFRRYQKPGKPR